MTYDFRRVARADTEAEKRRDQALAAGYEVYSTSIKWWEMRRPADVGAPTSKRAAAPDKRPAKTAEKQSIKQE